MPLRAHLAGVRHFRWIVALVVGAACYRNVPAVATPFAPGERVRLYLTPDAESRLAARLGPETIAVEGRVDSTSPAGVLVVVARTTKRTGGTVTWMGERVALASADIAHGERRVLDHKRTLVAALTAGIAAGVALAVLITQGGAGSGSDTGGGVIQP